MSWITDSKIFNASSNKSAILAASKSPINQELMRQVASYLSEDTIDELQSMEPKDIDVIKDEDIDDTAAEADAGKVDAPAPSHFSKSSEPQSKSLTEDMTELSDSGLPDERDTEVEVSESSEKSEEEPQQDVESSEAISVYDYNDLVDQLNSDDSTAGVRRVSNNDNEIWIYYSDDINLNNIMDSVIECVMKCCPNTDFNRLARSKNAIVFMENE